MRRQIAKTEHEQCWSMLNQVLPDLTTSQPVRCCYVIGHAGYHCEQGGRITWHNRERPTGEIPNHAELP